MDSIVAWVGLAGAVLLFVAACFDLIASWCTTRRIRDAADAAVELAGDAGSEPGNLQRQSAFDVASHWDALARVAATLKDLDRGSRLFVLSLAYLTVAGLTVGLASIGDGLSAP